MFLAKFLLKNSIVVNDKSPASHLILVQGTVLVVLPIEWLITPEDVIPKRFVSKEPPSPKR